VQPHFQARQAVCAPDRIRRRPFADHQAGAGQDSVAMGDFDRFVDGKVEAEIIRREDDLFQLATC
jgi:hypothetical protein